jgi:REP element-mobilizing transposase RayT
MARPLRIEYDGAIYHLTSRGNERKHIFRDDEDRLTFLDVLQKVNERFNWICHAYCLMNNHYHLIIETPDGNLSKGMRQLNGVYTQLFNQKHRRAGHLFQGRYKAILIEKENYLLEVSRYVVLNPVRAKAVTGPAEWQWSSYRSTAGMEKPHQCNNPEWILGQFGAKKRQAEKQYREFVAAGIREKGIWNAVRGQSILGEDDFSEKLLVYVKAHEDVKEIPKRQRYLNRPLLTDIFEDGGITDSAMKKAVMEHGYSQKDVAEFLGLHYSTISRRVNKSDNARNKT